MSLNINKETNINATIYSDKTTLFFIGDIDSAEPGEYLTPIFEKVIKQIDEAINLDVSELEFINSSGIKCFVSFILEKSPEVSVKFIIDKSKSWQEKTLEVIQSLDEDNIELVEK